MQPNPIKPRIEQLDFDPNNPRFLDTFGQNVQPDAQAIERMLDEENIHELIGSISQQGYFAGEPLLVTPAPIDPEKENNPEEPKRFIVVEGNRRLAALRLLNGLIPTDGLPESTLELIRDAVQKPPEVDCLEFPERRDILKYLGFRHISGPRRWEPLSKARYLADLIQNFYKDLPQEAQYRAVAKDIGSRRDYVAQLLAALNLYETSRQENYFGLQRLEEKDISFSLITTALSYSGIIKFLQLQGRDDATQETLNKDSLKSLLVWMFVQNENGETLLKDSRRLKYLAAVVDTPAALAELQKTKDLDRAYVFTEGPAAAMTKLLESALISLNECNEMILHDFTPDSSHIAQIDRLLNAADNLQILAQKTFRQRAREEAAGNEQAREEAAGNG